MAKLYEISDRYNNLAELLDNEEIDSTQLVGALQEVQGEFIEKAENIAKMIKNTQADIEGFKTEEKRLADRRKSLENKQKSLKEYVDGEMKTMGLDKAKGNIFSFNIQKNPPSVNIINEDIIPKYFYIEQAPVLDKKGVLEKLKNGEEIPGVELKQTKSLRIR